MMAAELNNKIALVTGASRGIGAAIARDLARAGATVVLNYRQSTAKADAVRAEIEGAGGRAFAVQADVAHCGEIDAMFDRVEAELGPVDILVNNAAVETRGSALACPEIDYDRILDTNLKGAFRCAQRVLPGMKSRRWGRIINISSVHELTPTGFCAPYSMSKGGLLMMTRELALEFSPFGITVNNVTPGAIRTDMNSAVLADPACAARLIAQTPARMVGDPIDVARAVVFLALPAARFITGASLVVDGGLSL